MTRVHEKCAGCRFWLAKPSTFVDSMDPDFGFGQCRRSPPRIIGEMVRVVMPRPEYGVQIEPEIDLVTLTSATLYPATGSGDWCGQFEPQPPAVPL